MIRPNFEFWPLPLQQIIVIVRIIYQITVSLQHKNQNTRIIDTIICIPVERENYNVHSDECQLTSNLWFPCNLIIHMQIPIYLLQTWAKDWDNIGAATICIGKMFGAHEPETFHAILSLAAKVPEEMNDILDTCKNVITKRLLRSAFQHSTKFF